MIAVRAIVDDIRLPLPELPDEVPERGRVEVAADGDDAMGDARVRDLGRDSGVGRAGSSSTTIVGTNPRRSRPPSSVRRWCSDPPIPVAFCTRTTVRVSPGHQRDGSGVPGVFCSTAT